MTAMSNGNTLKMTSQLQSRSDLDWYTCSLLFLKTTIYNFLFHIPPPTLSIKLGTRFSFEEKNL